MTDETVSNAYTYTRKQRVPRRRSQCIR